MTALFSVFISCQSSRSLLHISLLFPSPPIHLTSSILVRTCTSLFILFCTAQLNVLSHVSLVVYHLSRHSSSLRSVLLLFMKPIVSVITNTCVLSSLFLLPYRDDERQRNINQFSSYEESFPSKTHYQIQNSHAKIHGRWLKIAIRAFVSTTNRFAIPG